MHERVLGVRFQVSSFRLVSDEFRRFFRGNGASDRIAAYPADAPVAPADLTATILYLLGVPLDTELHDRTGRLVRVCDGTPIRELLGQG